MGVGVSYERDTEKIMKNIDRNATTWSGSIVNLRTLVYLVIYDCA